MVSDDAIPVAAGDHVVQFYESDEELIERTGRHLAGAIRSGAVAIVIASPAHARGFETWISVAGIDLAAAVAETRYVALDARTTLQRFRVNGKPDARLFERVVGDVVRSAAATGRQVCAYGEMVALLWDEGRVNAAIELESLWNDLSARVPFSLFCSYPSAAMMGSDQAELLNQVCCLHTAAFGVDPQRRSTRAFEASPDAPRAARQFVGEMARLVDGTDAGAVVINHTHNQLVWSPSHGQPLSPAGYERLFESQKPVIFSEAKLFADVVAGGPLDLSRVDPREAVDADPALTIVASRDRRVYARHSLDAPTSPPGHYQINPLYNVASQGTNLFLRLQFPNSDYEDEYGACKQYLPDETVIDRAALESLQQGGDPGQLDELIRRRVIVKLPLNYY
jgi:hypothetical protein